MHELSVSFKSDSQKKVEQRYVMTVIGIAFMYLYLYLFQSLLADRLLGGQPMEWGRVREYNSLKYSLRALEKNIPWVRNVFIISKEGLVPDWIDPTHPKITILKDEDIWPERYKGKFKVTFNSNNVDINLGRIPGISECFVYFNDDMFVDRPTKKSDFCDRNNIPQIYTTARLAAVSGKSNNIWHRCIQHTANQIRSLFSHAKGVYHVAHGPYAMSTRAFDYIYQHLDSEIERTMSAFTRQPTDLQTPLLQGWVAHEVLQAPAIRAPKTFLYYHEVQCNDIRLETIKTTILNRRPQFQFVCLNDKLNDKEKDMQHWYKQIDAMYTALYPQRSSFELVKK